MTTDIDECAEGTDQCEQQCHNTVGSYNCNCTAPGYLLHSDGRACDSKFAKKIAFHVKIRRKVLSSDIPDITDINECAEDTDSCAQTCTDTDGSYVCSCDTGFWLANDSLGCDGA